MKFRKKLHLPILVALLAVLSFVHSLFWPPDEQIFITDSIFITPRTQPFFYIVLIFASVGVILSGLYLGLLLTVFLFKKGIIFQTVGVFILIMTGVFAYLLITGQNVERNSDYVIGGILILFMGTIGVLMTLANRIGKRKRKK
jgi:hypothetical protein